MTDSETLTVPEVSQEWSMPHLDRIAWRKSGKIPGWAACKYEVIGPMDGPRDFLLEGGVPGRFKSGPRKGKASWRNVPTTRVVVSHSELDAERSVYARHTGNCPDCMGEGHVFSSWSVDAGRKTRPCRNCGGAGKHSQAE